MEKDKWGRPLYPLTEAEKPNRRTLPENKIRQLKDNLFYISQGKNNYAPLTKTLLFGLDNGKLTTKGFTSKHDKDFIQEEQYMTKQAPAKEEAKTFMLDMLQEQGGKMETSELAEWAKAMSISEVTLKRAKTKLKKEGKLEFSQPGGQFI